MKWFGNLFYFGLLLMLLSSFYGCSLSKKIIKTNTIKTIKVDTILIVKTDTIYRKVEKNIFDTVTIQTKTFRVISFVDTIRKKIIVEAKGENFDLPVKIDQEVKTSEKVKEVKKKQNFLQIIPVLILICLALLLIYKLIKT